MPIVHALRFQSHAHFKVCWYRYMTQQLGDQITRSHMVRIPLNSGSKVGDQASSMVWFGFTCGPQTISCNYTKDLYIR